MKKNGFTLAEVLITLAIIGVVATMTLPGLVTNTGEQQAKTGLRKGINTLTEAAQMNKANNGFDYSEILAIGTLDLKVGTGETDKDGKEIMTDANTALMNIFSDYTQIDNKRTLADGTNNIPVGGDSGSYKDTVHLRDGSAIIMPKKLATGYNVNTADGLPTGFVIVYDTNGLKAPNALSNCLGTATGDKDKEDVVNEKGEVTTPGSDCSDKSKRMLKDQFTLRLRGTVVEPEGAAARWTYEN